MHLWQHGWSWGYYAKWNKSDRKGQRAIVWFHSCMEYKKSNEPTKQNTDKLLDTSNIIVVARGEGGWGKAKWVKRCQIYGDE